MIMNWLTRAGWLGLRNHIWLLIAAGLGLAAFVIVKVADNAVEDVIATTKDAGATEQREADLIETIKNVEKARDAVEKVDRDPAAARAECLRNARNPGNC